MMKGSELTGERLVADAVDAHITSSHMSMQVPSVASADPAAISPFC